VISCSYASGDPKEMIVRTAVDAASATLKQAGCKLAACRQRSGDNPKRNQGRKRPNSYVVTTAAFGNDYSRLAQIGLVCSGLFLQCVVDD
jgi:hypothetical protein